MSPEIEAGLQQEVAVLGGDSETGENSVDSAATSAEREAESELWAIGNTFADDGFNDDGNSTFPAEDRGPARDGAPSWEEHPHLRRPSGFRPDLRDVETNRIASRGGQTMNARRDDGNPEIG